MSLSQGAGKEAQEGRNCDPTLRWTLGQGIDKSGDGVTHSNTLEYSSFLTDTI